MVDNPSLQRIRSIQNFFITVEGIGNENGLYRFSYYNAPSFDTNNLYKAVLLEFPQEIGVELELFSFESKQTGQTFVLQRTPLTMSLFLAPAEPLVTAKATSGVTATSTSIITDKTGLAGSVVFWEREAILLGSEGSSGTYTGCTRGYLGTMRQRHAPPSQNADVEIFSTMHPTTLSKRIVKLYVVPSSVSSYTEDIDDSNIIWTGVLDSCFQQTGTEITLETSDILSLLKDAVLMEKPAIFSSRNNYISNQVPDNGYGDINADTNGFTVVEESSKRVADAQYQRFTNTGGSAYRLNLFSFNTIYDYPLAPVPDTQGDRTEDFIYKEVHTTATFYSNSASADTFTLPLSQNIGTLILQLLTTTPQDGNISAVNGDYDLGINNLGAAIDQDLVDTDAILAWSRRVGILPVDNLWLGLEGPEPLMDVLKKLLAPYGGILTVGRNGKFRIVNIQDAIDFNTTNTISPNEIVSEDIYFNRNLLNTLDRVIVRTTLIPSLDRQTDDTIDVYKSQRLPKGARTQLELDCGYYSSRRISRGASINFLFRFRNPPPTIIFETLPSANYYVGDLVSVTHENIPNGQGTLGLEGATCIVVGRKEIFEVEEEAGYHGIEYTLALVSGIYKSRQAYIAPSGKVASYNAGTRTITLEVPFQFMFPTNEYFDPKRDISAFSVGDLIQWTDEYGTPIETLAEIGSINVAANTITLKNNPSTNPSINDIIRVAQYGDASSSQRDKWCFLADANNELDGTNNYYSYVLGG